MRTWIETHLSNLLATVLILLIISVVYFVTSIFIKRTIKERQNRYLWRNRLFYISLFVVLYLIGDIWFESFRVITAVLSLIAAALVITHKEFLMNLTGCLLVHSKKLFKHGDIIKIKDYEGEVTHIGLLGFSILSTSPFHAGLVKVPNNLVFTNTVLNYSEPYSYTLIQFQTRITPESDFEKAKAILLEIIIEKTDSFYLQAKAHAKVYRKTNLISTEFRAPEVFIHLNSEGLKAIEIEALFLYYPNSSKGITDQITAAWLNIIKDEPSIQIAFFEKH